MELTLNHLEAAGSALVRDGQAGLAVDFLLAAMAAAPGVPGPAVGLCTALRTLDRPVEAETVIRAVLDLEPTARRRVALAGCLSDQTRHGEAAAVLRQAIAQEPDCWDASGALAECLRSLWLAKEAGDEALDEMMALAEAGIAAASPDLKFHGRRLDVLQLTGRNEEWLAEAERLAERHPELYEFHRQRALALIMLGDLRRGLPLHADTVFHRPGTDRRPIDQRRKWWPNQEPGPVLVWHAEGAGDMWWFARYFAPAARYGAELEVVADVGMERLLERCPGVTRVTSPTELRAGRVTTLHDLASAFTTRECEIPPPPYLGADADTITQWRIRLRKIRGLRVGVAWSGNPNHWGNRRRSFDVSDLAPLFGVPGVSLISLQKGHRAELVGTPILDLGDEYQAGDWLETAAVIHHLDLVICPDSGIAHLAGAMARPVWVALPEPGEVRWMVGRTDSPWYPTMRLFRQPTRGSWAGVFEAMAEAVRQRKVA